MSREKRQGSVRQVALIVNWNVLQLRMLLPVLIKHQEELLGFTKGKDRHQALSAAKHDVSHSFRKLLFSLLLVRVFRRAIRALHNEYVDFAVSELCWLQYAVLLPTVVTRVEDLDPINLDEKHGGSQDVTRSES